MNKCALVRKVAFGSIKKARTNNVFHLLVQASQELTGSNTFKKLFVTLKVTRINRIFKKYGVFNIHSPELFSDFA